MRSATAAAALIALCGTAHGQVTSMWLGQDLIPNWSDEDNWVHDDPSIDTYPNNGNEGKTYTVLLDALATMGESITIDALTMEGGAGLNGGIDLRVLGQTTFQSGNVGFLTAGTAHLDGLVSVPGLLNINDTVVFANDVNVGNTGNGAVRLNGNGKLICSSIAFLKDGNVTSLNGDAPLLKVDGIVKTGGLSLSTVQCTTELLETFGFLECSSGELRFAQPIQGSTYPVMIPSVNVKVTNGSKLTFSRTVNISGTMDVFAEGQVIFNNGTFDLSGGTIKGSGDGTIELVGGGASMSNGVLECSNGLPFQFIAGTIGPMPITNKGAFEWSGGTMEGAGPGQAVFINDASMPVARTIASMQGVGRIVTSGAFQNKATFIQTHNVDLGQDGTIVNDAFSFWTINDARLQPVPNTDNNAYINNGTFTAEGIGTSLVSVCFENNQTVICKSGTLQFTDAKQFDEDAKTLIGGNWCVEGTGQILLGNTDLEVIGPGATVQTKGGGKIGIEKVKTIEGCAGLYAATTVTVFEQPVELTGKLDISDGLQDTEVSIVDLLTDDGNLIIKPKGSVDVGDLSLSGDAEIDFLDSIPLTADSPSLTTTTATWNEGTLHGTGTWTCQEPLAIEGTVDPGIDDEYGHLVFDGDAGFEPPSAVTWNFDDAPGPFNNDLITVTGTATLGGTLQVTQLGGGLAQGEVRVILQAGEVSGAFDEALLPEGHALRYTSTEVQLIACIADFNGDGVKNILDFVAFQNAFTSGDLAADCNGDGLLNILDFVCFQNEFESC